MSLDHDLRHAHQVNPHSHFSAAAADPTTSITASAISTSSLPPPPPSSRPSSRLSGLNQSDQAASAQAQPQSRFVVRPDSPSEPRLQHYLRSDPQTHTQGQAQDRSQIHISSPSPTNSAFLAQQPQYPLRRIAVQPPRLTTALAPPPPGDSFLHGITPASASSLSQPFSPYPPPSSATSAYASSTLPPPSPMAMRNTQSVPYNPQQWGRNGVVAGRYLPHPAAVPTSGAARLQEITGMESAMPSPPPPYSPGQPASISQSLHSSPHLSAGAFSSNTPPPPPPPVPPSADYIPSPSSRPVSTFYSRPGSMVVPSSATSTVSMSQFPPPPTNNKRSASRDKLSSKFGLPSFRRSGESAGPSNIDSLRLQTTEALQRAPASPGLPPLRASQPPFYGFPERARSPDHQSSQRAPNSRRAASTGVLGLESRTPIDDTPVPSQGSWAPDLPLPPPPPPPGPPPGSSRSQSLGRGMDSTVVRRSVHQAAPPTRRPGQSTVGQSTLGPIPPTPIGWAEEQERQRSRSPAVHGLHLDTSPQTISSRSQATAGSEVESTSNSSGPTATTSTSTSASRSTLHKHSRRDSSVRGIRERRSESRAAKERSEESNNPYARNMEPAPSQPADLDLSSPEGGLSRRGAVTRNTPRSGGGLRSPRSTQLADEPGSSASTPRMELQRKVASAAAPTPPFSPGTDNFDRHHKSSIGIVPSRALPTPPLHPCAEHNHAGVADVPGDLGQTAARTPNLTRGSTESAMHTPRAIVADRFAQDAIERHREFIEQEVAADSDLERLELFADFIVKESRLRRDRYAAAFDSMAADVLELTRDLWRSNNAGGRQSAAPNTQSTTVPGSGRRSQASNVEQSPDTRKSASNPTTAASPASSVTNLTQPDSASPDDPPGSRPRDIAWNYQPVLSPILSTAMSTVPDEQDSRGRSASRWWESNDGESTGVGGRRLERSKRESKYMGVPKEAMQDLQWMEAGTASPAFPAGSSSRQQYGPNEYPAEKVGWHEEEANDAFASSVPPTPDPRKMDVSRLVTLPPPYPRHHPAVNNNHPDLASIRTSLRSVSELGDVQELKDRFQAKVEARKDAERDGAKSRRAQLHENVQANVRNGHMTYEDAAKREADFEARERQRARDTVQNIFDNFQAEVANPLHAMFCERVNKVTASIEHLCGRLRSDAQELNPNQTQEEGDGQPELLETLTLLKWLFEVREQLHKELFDLEDARNDLYKDIIVLPYIQTANDQKVTEASDFFAKDAQDRRVAWEKEILSRYESFLTVTEQHVTRGVEAQLSAFWDIAPGLLAVVQNVPRKLSATFDIFVPPQECDENPAYRTFPMQYLYTVLTHARRSTYQFIESQTNLLCLLHEVRTGVMASGSKLLETQRVLAGDEKEAVMREMTAVRVDEERRLTEDLKERVGVVESQWDEALGSSLRDCGERVEEYLRGIGGWDDGLRE